MDVGLNVRMSIRSIHLFKLSFVPLTRKHHWLLQRCLKQLTVSKHTNNGGGGGTSRDFQREIECLIIQSKTISLFSLFCPDASVKHSGWKYA